VSWETSVLGDGPRTVLATAIRVLSWIGTRDLNRREKGRGR
jgi:hypothetical protein